MASIYTDPCRDGTAAAVVGEGVCPRQDGPWVLAATILASSIVMIDGTVVNVVLPILQAELSATAAQLQWIVESYALFLAALLLLGGAMGDRFGRRLVFTIGVAVFGVASLACAIAPTTNALIIARAAQGVGGALLVPGSLAILGASFAEKERGRAIGTWSAATALSIAVGPILGGWLAENVSWRWIFLINLPLAVAVIAITAWRVPESRDESISALDYRGAALATLGLGASIYALIEASHLGLTAAPVLVAGVVGLVSLCLFAWSQTVTDHPMVPVSLFESKTFTGANLLTVLLYGALGAAFFILPFNLIQLHGYSVTAAAAVFLPFVIIMGLFSRYVGDLADRWGARPLLIVGPAIAAVGFAMYLLPGTQGSYWTTFFPAILVQSIGMTLTVTPLTSVVMSSVPEGSFGIASGINNIASRAAGLIAIALFGLIFLTISNALFQQNLAAALPEQAASLAELSMSFGALDIDQAIDAALVEPIQAASDAAFLFSFRVSYAMFALMAGASALIAFFTIEPARYSAASKS